MATKKTESAFPIELLEADIDTRVAWFDAKAIASHARQEYVMNRVLRARKRRGGKRILMVIGPAGAGKTCTYTLLTENLRILFANDPMLLPGDVPVVSMEAVTHGKTAIFDWEDFIKRFLIDVAEPLVSAKITNLIKEITIGPGNRQTFKREVSSPNWLLIFEDTQRNRHVRVFLIDESQDMARIASGRKMRSQMDALKSLQAQTGTLYVLFGTYDLLNLTALSGQLLRRTEIIHFSRYDYRNPKDVKDFKDVVSKLERLLPVKVRPNLVSDYKKLHHLCLGCVGLLKDLLTRALELALERGMDTVTLELCEEAAETPQDLIRLMWEIQDGERRLVFSEKQNKADAELVKKWLETGEISTDNPLSEHSQDEGPARQTKGKKRVGERALGRDPVGRKPLD